MQPEGPVIDWLKQLIAALWAMLGDLVAGVVHVAQSFEAKLDRLESRLETGFWFIVGLFAVMTLLHALIGAWSRKKWT